MGRKELMQKLAAAPANGVGNNIRDGKYRFAIKKMGFIDGVKGTRHQTTLTVVNAAKVDSVFMKTEKGHKEGELVNATPNPVGSDVDYLCVKLNEMKSVGPGNIRRLLLDLFGKSDLPDAEYYETLQEATDTDSEGNNLPNPKNPTKGMLIDAETVRIVTAEKQVEIITVKWSHVKPESYDQNAYANWIDSVAAAAAAPAQLQAGAAA